MTADDRIHHREISNNLLMKVGCRIPAEKNKQVRSFGPEASGRFDHIKGLVVPVQRQPHSTDAVIPLQQVYGLKLTVFHPFHTKMHDLGIHPVGCEMISKSQKSHRHVIEPDKIADRLVKIIKLRGVED